MSELITINPKVKLKVLARFSGWLEFGPRALGNRSILADPRDRDIIREINDMVKMRDFWMPFWPLEELLVQQVN